MSDSLFKTALLGTSQSQREWTDLPQEILALFAESPGASPEAALLDRYAANLLFTRSGQRPQTGLPRPSEAPKDMNPECTLTAASLFLDLLDAHRHELLLEWLELAEKGGLRLPARLLPQLLDLAKRQPAFRKAALAVADARGQWLMQFNPNWQFATTQVDEGLWQTGTKDERAAVLRHVRSTNPEKARSLIQETWATDPAEDRSRWVEFLGQELSTDDEPFLETCLDDRSARVREAAADRLAKLPASRLVLRMIERAEPLLRLVPPIPANLLKLKKGTAARFEVTLPDTFDKTWLRDGLKEKPSERLGAKQWHLYQILSYVPLAHWTTTLKINPEAILAALPEDFSGLIIRAFVNSYANVPESTWTLSLIEHFPGKAEISADFYPAIPVEQRPSAIKVLAKRADEQSGYWLSHILNAWKPLDPQTSLAILSAVTAETLATSSFWQAAHPTSLELLEQRLESLPEARHYRAEQVLSDIALRRRIELEFTQ